jgi:hypothetical protein
MSLANTHAPEGAIASTAVGVALAALGTELKDSLSKDPEGFFAMLRSDARRILLFKLLANLPTVEVARLLQWMAANAPPQDATNLLLRVGMTPAGSRLAAAERRAVFARLLSPDRLALVLELCQADEAWGRA